VPEWYYLPFYAILRSIPNKLAGVVAMFGAIIILAFLPWLDSAKTRSSKYRPLAKQFFWIFVVVCIGLGYLGAQPPEGIYVIVGRILTFLYFAYFLILLPVLSRIEKPRPLPNSIADDVLAKSGGKAAPMVSSVIALMVAGGLLFARSALRAGWLPKVAVCLFAAGLVINLLLALLPAPEILQTLGTTLRNLGLMWIGYAILSDSPRSVVDQAESG
jgi:hypothetical protein